MLSSDEIRTIRRNEVRRKRRQAIRHRLVDRHPFCFYCAYKMTHDDSTLDHFIPLSAGGPDEESNFVLACRRCNRRKSNHNFEHIATGLIPGWGIYLIRDVQRMNERFALNPNWKKRRR